MSLDVFKLDGRVALITGGNRGLGFAMAQALADAGANVVVTSRQEDRAMKSAATLATITGQRTLGIAVNITDAAQIESMIQTVVNEFGRIDILVNNAGINIRKPVEELDEASWDLVQDTNLKAPFLCSRAAARHMKEHGGGSIVNCASIAGINAGAGLASYRASKAAVIHLSRSMAIDLAQYQIRVNCIAPGQIQTGMTSYDLDAVIRFTQPLQRHGGTDDVANAVVYLASDRSAQVTGILLPIDGGTTAGPPASQLKLMLGAASERQE